MDEEREKIIEKALKLRELANRGVGGEKQNAIRFLETYKTKHNLTDEELNSFVTFGDSWYDSVTKEEQATGFARWFKRSVAYDYEKNTPIVFYHYSREAERFTEFDETKGTKMYHNSTLAGFHFSNKEDRANIQHSRNTNVGGGTDYYVYLRMQNPYYIYARLNGESFGSNGEQYRPIEINKRVVDFVKELGHDSIIIQDEYGYNVYIVFNPNQIKSVENNGEYSEANNIYC